MTRVEADPTIPIIRITRDFQFEGRDAWLRSGMEIGVEDGYTKLERMLAHGAV